jgi:hypothetical protein
MTAASMRGASRKTAREVTEEFYVSNALWDAAAAKGVGPVSLW